MAKRLHDTEVWKKEWFRRLKPEYKCFWNYLLSNCSHAGIWDVDFGLVEFQIGASIDIEVAKDFFKDQILVLNEGSKWFIKDFTKFQYGHDLNEKSPVHKKVIDTLKSIKHKNHTLYDTLCNRVCDTAKEKEEEKEEEEAMAEEKETTEKNFIIHELKDEIIEAELSPTFDDFWDEYDKKKGSIEKLKPKWNKLSQKEREAIMEYIPNYKISQPDKQYRLNPETFLNNKSWNDELIFKSPGILLNSGGKIQTVLSQTEELQKYYASKQNNIR